jgi:hypothetical protein
MTHRSTGRGWRLGVKASDQHPFAAAYARRRSKLADSPLAGRCLPELHRLIDHDTHLEMERLHGLYRGMPHPGPLDISGLGPAAEAVLAAAQEHLAESRESRRFDFGVAYALASAQWLARRAHNRAGFAPQRTKRVEIDAAVGVPLGVCTGTPLTLDLPKWAPPPLGVSPPHGRRAVSSARSACWQIFDDTPDRTGGTYWSRWCDECHPIAGWRSDVDDDGDESLQASAVGGAGR